jgi:DNA-binding NarL/FixJ family response regulator
MRSPHNKRLQPDAETIATLTTQEQRVFTLMGEGLTTVELANHLAVSTSTIATVRDRLKKKLGLANTNQLIREAAIWVYLQG